MTFQDLNNHAVALLNSQQQQQQPPQQQQQEQEDGEIHDGNVGILEDAITYFREALHHARATISFKGGSSNGGSATTKSSYIWRLGGGHYYGPTQKRGEMTNTESDTVLGLIMSSKSSNSTSCTTKKSYYRQHLFTRMFTIHHIEDDVAVVDPCTSSVWLDRHWTRPRVGERCGQCCVGYWIPLASRHLPRRGGESLRWIQTGPIVACCCWTVLAF